MKPTKFTRKLLPFLATLEPKPAHVGVEVLHGEINSHIVGKEMVNFWLLLYYDRIAPNISKEDNLAFKCKGHDAVQAFMTIVDPSIRGVLYDAS